MTLIDLSVRQLAWATDLHLNFAAPDSLCRFIEALAQTPVDAVAITGDVSDGPHLEQHLSLVAESVRKPIFVLLGNHDRYHTSFAQAEESVRRVVAAHPHVYRLTGKEIFKLSEASALVGIDGWADGRSGSGSDSPIVLNDTICIRDLAKVRPAIQWRRIAEFSQNFALTMKPTLEAAMASFQHVFLLTHVPPLPEATWHEGRISGPDFLPHFCNANLGEVIREACDQPHRAQLTVLCGHTHSAGVHQENNLTILTAGAIYGAPRVDRVLPIPGLA